MSTAEEVVKHFEDDLDVKGKQNHMLQRKLPKAFNYCIMSPIPYVKFLL